MRYMVKKRAAKTGRRKERDARPKGSEQGNQRIKVSDILEMLESDR